MLPAPWINTVDERVCLQTNICPNVQHLSGWETSLNTQKKLQAEALWPKHAALLIPRGLYAASVILIGIREIKNARCALFFSFHFLSFIIEKKKIHGLTIFRLHKTTHIFTIEFHLFLYSAILIFTIYDNDFEIYIPSFWNHNNTTHTVFNNISTGPIWFHRMKNVCMHIFLLNELSPFFFSPIFQTPNFRDGSLSN